jgi:pyruvate kinase
MEILENNDLVRAQIVATIGPASSSVETIKAMIEKGMDIARLNFSHGTHDGHKKLIELVRSAASELQVHIPIIQDLSGPRLVTSDGHHLDPHSVQVITEKDRRDLAFGISEGLDYIALSFVQGPEDITELRSLIESQGAHTPIIAKIERKEALDNLEAIVKVADAIMVARGDLGDNVPIEQLPFIERDIIQTSKLHGKPVITATQMMLSMVDHPEPTRAEVTDVAYAVMLGSDAVMLSEESASGKYPVKSVEIMNRIIKETEKQSHTNKL